MQNKNIPSPYIFNLKEVKIFLLGEIDGNFKKIKLNQKQEDLLTELIQEFLNPDTDLLEINFF